MEISEEVRQELAQLLATAADLQGQFWDACRDIEVELGLDIEELSISDLSHWNVDHLVAIAVKGVLKIDQRGGVKLDHFECCGVIGNRVWGGLWSGGLRRP